VPIRPEIGRYAPVHRRLARDPLLCCLGAAPVDDEPVTVEEDLAIAEVEADRAAGVPTVRFDDVKRRYA
jgi:hypothetical protein